MLYFRFRRFLVLIVIPIVLVFPTRDVSAQHHTVHIQKRVAPQAAASNSSTIELIGIRPGISLDSVETIIHAAGSIMREVQQDTLTHCFADRSIRIFVVDSLMCRLAWMRMSFLFDGNAKRLRRFSLTPRQSSIESGQTDDINAVLLLYFGERWGKPDINFDPPACFKWHSGNTDVRGFIKRGYPLWVMED